MRQWILVAVLLIVMTGCARQQGPETYGVIFDGTPSLFDRQVYHMGERIGDIIESRTGANLAVKLDVVIDPDRRALLTESSVFFVSAGRLNLASLSATGAPLAPGANFLGFGSKISLALFKVRNLLGQPSAAARAKTMSLAAAL
ncbi:MAG: hypothetical protein JEZ11_00325 [Desulfobacterales bacterium]|nr:hypothetical protein [Desulfobacterales bacterium]